MKKTEDEMNSKIEALTVVSNDTTAVLGKVKEQCESNTNSIEQLAQFSRMRDIRVFNVKVNIIKNNQIMLDSASISMYH